MFLSPTGTRARPTRIDRKPGRQLCRKYSNHAIETTVTVVGLTSCLAWRPGRRRREGFLRPSRADAPESWLQRRALTEDSTISRRDRRGWDLEGPRFLRPGERREARVSVTSSSWRQQVRPHFSARREWAERCALRCDRHLGGRGGRPGTTASCRPRDAGPRAVHARSHHALPAWPASRCVAPPQVPACIHCRQHGPLDRGRAVEDARLRAITSKRARPTPSDG